MVGADDLNPSGLMPKLVRIVEVVPRYLQKGICLLVIKSREKIFAAFVATMII